MEFSLCQGWMIAKLSFLGPCFYNFVTQNQPKGLLCPRVVSVWAHWGPWPAEVYKPQCSLFLSICQGGDMQWQQKKLQTLEKLMTY